MATSEEKWCVGDRVSTPHGDGTVIQVDTALGGCFCVEHDNWNGGHNASGHGFSLTGNACWDYRKSSAPSKIQKLSGKGATHAIIKVGGFYKPKPEKAGVCGSFQDSGGEYIEVVSVDDTFSGSNAHIHYFIFRNGKRVDSCFCCFTPQDLEEYDPVSKKLSKKGKKDMANIIDSTKSPEQILREKYVYNGVSGIDWTSEAVQNVVIKHLDKEFLDEARKIQAREEKKASK